MATLNINQFKQLLDSLPEDHTLLVEGSKPYTPCVTIVEKKVSKTYFLATQKNELRWFKSVDSLINAIGASRIRRLSLKVLHQETLYSSI